MKILKNLIIFILEIVLTVALSIIFIMNIASSTVLNKQYVLTKLESNNYYTKVLGQVESNFEKYIHQSGLNENVLDDLVTEEQVKQDTLKIINNIYEETEENISTEEIKQKLMSNIKNSVEKNQVLQQDAVNTFVKTICTEYTDTLFHTKYEKDINNVYLKVIEYMPQIKTSAIAMLAVSIILLIVVNIKTIFNFITNIGVSILATGGFFTFLNIYINSKINVKNITILNNEISEVLRNILQEVLSLIMKYGVLSIVIGFLIVVISIFVGNRKLLKNVEKN